MTTGNTHIMARPLKFVSTGADGTLYRDLLSGFDAALVEDVLKMVKGNQVKAAAKLGINRNTLRKKMLAAGLTSEMFK